MAPTSRYPDGRKRLNVYLEPDLYDKLQALADLNRRSLTAQAAVCIDADMTRREEVRANPQLLRTDAPLLPAPD